MPHAYGGAITAETVAEINELFVKLEEEVSDKRVRKMLDRLNKYLHNTSGGVIAYVNWNS
jgi:hypothetical protein